MKLQNIAKQSQSLWSNRWGHALATVVVNGGEVLVLLGGDSHYTDSGVGVLMNDVWIGRNLSACPAPCIHGPPVPQ